MTTENEAMQSYCRAIEASHAKDMRHMETRINELEKLMEAKFDAAAQAIDKADVATLARFESVNEFRATLSDQTKEFVTRSVFDAKTGELGRRVGSIEERLAGYDGRIIGWSTAMGLAATIVAFLLQILNVGG